MSDNLEFSYLETVLNSCLNQIEKETLTLTYHNRLIIVAQ